MVKNPQVNWTYFQLPSPDICMFNWRYENQERKIGVTKRERDA